MPEPNCCVNVTVCAWYLGAAAVPAVVSARSHEATWRMQFFDRVQLERARSRSRYKWPSACTSACARAASARAVHMLCKYKWPVPGGQGARGAVVERAA